MVRPLAREEGRAKPGRDVTGRPRWDALLGVACHPGRMEVSTGDIAGLPAENLRVSRSVFAAVWTAAERQHDECVRRGVTDWRGAGVVVACRWLAAATIRPANGPWHPARSPVTGHTHRATPELIEEECRAAELLAMRRPVPDWLETRPGWVEGVVATLNWTWRGSGEPPVDVEHTAAR
jgi:hypothetical protein